MLYPKMLLEVLSGNHDMDSLSKLHLSDNKDSFDLDSFMKNFRPAVL